VLLSGGLVSSFHTGLHAHNSRPMQLLTIHVLHYYKQQPSRTAWLQLLLGMWVCGINKNNAYNVDMMEKIILRVRVADMRALMV